MKWYRVLPTFFFQAEDGIRDLVRSRVLGDVYKRQALTFYNNLYNQLIISDSLWKVLGDFELGNYQIEEAKLDAKLT